MKYEFNVELRKTNFRRRKSERGCATISRQKKQLVLSHQIVKYMEENNIQTLKEMSQNINISVARLSQLLQPQLLHSQIQEKLLLD